MKAPFCESRLLFALLLFVAQPVLSQSAGRVVINEYLPWPSNSCGTTAEFVELLNMGPGPVDIGCYVLTTGKYSVTIPPNTVLKSGDFYVLAGEDFIPGDCGNLDSIGSGIHVNLNWNTCNCTNVAIPKAGDGLMTDGGSSNTPLVLLNPALKVVDAVVRSLPTEATSLIATSTLGGRCARKSFDLGLIPVTYEQIGMSAGRGNSFARTVDGDCGWIKETQQSGNATNDRPSDVSGIDYIFSMMNALDCAGQGGKVSVYVNYGNYADIFPMTYTLALDSNRNGLFDAADAYAIAVDSTAPSLVVDNLSTGHYRLTVEASRGCFVKTFEFSIAACSSTLPLQLASFTHTARTNGNYLLRWKLHGIELLEITTVQASVKGDAFTDERTLTTLPGEYGAKTYEAELSGNYRFFRLRMTGRRGDVFYSPVLTATTAVRSSKVWPNPAAGTLNVQLSGVAGEKLLYRIFNGVGKSVAAGDLSFPEGWDVCTLPIADLPPGLYQLQVNAPGAGGQPICMRFVKH